MKGIFNKTRDFFKDMFDLVMDNFMNFIILYVFIGITLYIIKMIDLYESLGHYPIDMTKLVLGAGTAEIILTAILTLGKRIVNRKQCCEIEDEVDTDGIVDKLREVTDRMRNRKQDNDEYDFYAHIDNTVYEPKMGDNYKGEDLSGQ